MFDIFEIILTVAMVGITIWVLFRISRRNRKKKKREDPQVHLERATWAWARILGSSTGSIALGGMQYVKLRLEIHLPGTSKYEAEVTWLVEQEMLAHLETGKDISLKADPMDLKYIYPSGSWARLVEDK